MWAYSGELLGAVRVEVDGDLTTLVAASLVRIVAYAPVLCVILPI